MLTGKRIYVAGPYTGDEAHHTRAAIEAAECLRNAGHCPFIPHLWYLWSLQHPRPYEDWMQQCIAWLSVCEAVVRLPGISSGSDREVAEAAKLGIPVFYSPLDAIMAYRATPSRVI